MRRFASILSTGFFAVGLVLSPSTSKASGRTISNVEASRLTLAALTAPPRPVVHTTRHRKRGYGRKMVVTASYRHKATKNGVKARFIRKASYRHVKSRTVKSRHTRHRG
ncbi:hypothetical protein N5W20_03130 [Candidatus Kirkpatrickella diaphorinae]|uniref:50S ribosomal protein L34 n=1 Tax=Candidatus Kirkpatrickella diaphorinae TaxID=2984322 RepID=A0ABY6GM11_9PROT|nr:hypothetical protein [Candidatus Kirkpatrickella diaphorinae]UYH51868.1 hypothetical protein N5W20_03130 [Candidatus Kirkpatrickella diaphorinae]